MTDYETLVALFRRAGIEHYESVEQVPLSASDYQPATEAEPRLTVYGGYVGFFTEFAFHPDGRLKSIKAWE